MKRTPILVCGDAGAAGRVLLARRDIELRWALTPREAKPVLASGFAQVCLVREALALDVLDELRVLPKESRPPCIVLIEANSWSKRELFFARGATALVRESNGERLLEAISELTGILFSACPRVPHVTVLDVVTESGLRYFLETVDLSASGISVRGLEGAAVGMSAELTFAMYEPPMTVRAMVVRTFHEDGQPIAGLTFVGINDRERARLAAVVESERRTLPRLPDPVGLSVDLDGPFTMDVGEALEHDENAMSIYRAMLRECVEHPESAAPLPGWLQRIATALTSFEREGLSKAGAPEWTKTVVDLRMQLRRQRLDEEDELSHELDAEKVIEICCALAEVTAKSDDAVAIAVTEIRADFLREIYGNPTKTRIGAETGAAVKPMRIERIAT